MNKVKSFSTLVSVESWL